MKQNDKSRMLLGTLGASLLGNMLAGKEIKQDMVLKIFRQKEMG